jgi:REP element-mobilizing transposase RayT
VWVTKYRYHVLAGEVKLRVRELIRQICQQHDLLIEQGHVSKDHVHSLVSAPTHLSASQIAKQELVQSMSRKGDCWDNAVAESFFSHLKGRLTEDTTYQNADSLRQDLFVYSDCYYARYRKHSANSWKTPEQAEREFLDELACHP